MAKTTKKQIVINVSLDESSSGEIFDIKNALYYAMCVHVKLNKTITSRPIDHENPMNSNYIGTI